MGIFQLFSAPAEGPREGNGRGPEYRPEGLVKGRNICGMARRESLAPSFFA